MNTVQCTCDRIVPLWYTTCFSLWASYIAREVTENTAEKRLRMRENLKMVENLNPTFVNKNMAFKKWR